MCLRHKQMTSSEQEKKYDSNRRTAADMEWQTSPQMPVDVVGCMWPCGFSSHFLFKTYSVHIICCDQSKLPKERKHRITPFSVSPWPSWKEKPTSPCRKSSHLCKDTRVPMKVSHFCFVLVPFIHWLSWIHDDTPQQLIVRNGSRGGNSW